MVHEAFNIENGIVKLPQKQVLLDEKTDIFYKNNMYNDFGSLGQEIKTLLEQYTIKHAQSQKIETLNDMKSFIENYPEFKRQGGNVGLHVGLVGEVSRVVEEERLLEVGEIQQGVAMGSDAARDFKVFSINPSLFKI